jgi:hypothetical protein
MILDLMACDLSEFLSPKDYYYAILGAGLGAWIGITVEKLRAKKKQRLIDRNARLDLTGALQKNIELIDQAIDRFQTQGQPNFPLETQRAAVLTDRISVFRDQNLRTHIEGLLYQCSHYNAKLLAVNSAYMTVLMNQGNPALLDPYSQMMIKHLQEIRDWTKEALAGLGNEENKT